VADSPLPHPRYVSNLLGDKNPTESQKTKFKKVGPGVWLYSAFVDEHCPEVGENSTCVTLLTLSEYNLTKEEEIWRCYLKSNGGSDSRGRVLFQKVEKESTGKNYLWKISCVGHLKLDVQTVRVVRENRVGATVKVERPKVNHKDQQVLGVCLAGVLWSDGEETTDDLISFLEYYRHVGAQMVTIYALPQVLKVVAVLDYYRSIGFLEVIEWDIPMNLLKSPSLEYFGQNVLLHDCLFRGRNQYEYLLYSDLDERILPTTPNTSLIENIRELDAGEISSFGLLVTFYLSLWKADMSRLKELYKGVQKIPNIREAILIERETRPQWEYKYRSRYIVKPHLVEELAIHYVARSVPGFRTLELSRDQIALAHFRTAKRSELDRLGVLDEHEVDLNLAHHYTPRLLERVNQVCNVLEKTTAIFNCNYIRLIK